MATLRGRVSFVLVLFFVAGCGGGSADTDVAITSFVPQQVIVLGDETNLLTVDGKRYGVNGMDANGAFDCRLLPIWTQSVAARWGLVFDRCNPGGSASTGAAMRAAFNAKAADLRSQIDAQLAVAVPNTKDLFTVLVGMHDIIELYEQFPGRSEADLKTEAAARGSHVAQQINRLSALGAKVVASTVPNLGLTPYALAQEAANPGRAVLLTGLTERFNGRMRSTLVGPYAGVVLADELVSVMVLRPSDFGLTNVTDAMCTTAAPDCTTLTLVTPDASSKYLWADDRRMGPVAHSQLAQMAVLRARDW